MTSTQHPKNSSDLQGHLTQQGPPPRSAPLTDDELLNLVTQASALQQSGLVDEALLTYKKLQAADPQGRYGKLAERAIQSLSQSIPSTPAPPPQPEALSFRGITYRTGQGDTNTKPWERLSQVPVVQRLLNLPIRQKQLVGLLTSEVVSVLGLVGVGSILIVTNLRTQLLAQAQAELAVTEISYNIKIDQMGFGFRGQSDNTAIISAATSNKSSPQVLAILRNEIAARNIEYATLVNRSAVVIAGANADRTGEVFNPNNLVTEAIQKNQQIKTTEVVSWEELQKEAPPLPDGFSESDALIRYTVTPVRNPSGQPIGALVSGDIVNGKTAITDRTLDAFNGGYSAVYFKNPETSLTKAAIALQQQASGASVVQPLLDSELINEAAGDPGQVVTGRARVGNEFYTLAAEAIPNYQGEPVGFLVRGTPETRVNQILQQSAIWQGLAVILVLFTDVGIATLLTRAIATPILRLKDSAQRLAGGDQTSRAQVQSQDEVGQLAVAFNQMADSIQVRTEEVERLASQRQKELEVQRQQTDLLQQRVLDLLLEIEGAQQGDLTVRARVTDDEMGSIADAFNATVSSLRQLVTQVQQVADQMNTSAVDSDRSMSELSHQALDQAQTVSKALASVESMAQSIETVAQSALETARIAREATESAKAGGVAMEQTVESIEELRSSVAETAKKVKRLTESSQEISKIVALISEISAKTNLLAFNASIEAVRAGEHGQGFRIVADEVRRLAERVSESTKDIEQLVSGIQLETAEVLTMMEKGTSQVVTSTKLVAETKQTLTGLMNISQSIDHLVDSISTSTASQSHMSQQLSQTMQDVAQVAATTSSESQQVSQRLKELLQVADQLQTSVSRFRVG